MFLFIGSCLGFILLFIALSDNPSPEDANNVTSYYGPGSYAAWIISAAASLWSGEGACHVADFIYDYQGLSKYSKPVHAFRERLPVTLPLDLGTVAVIMYPLFACGDAFLRFIRHGKNDPQFTAAINVVQISFLISSIAIAGTESYWPPPQASRGRSIAWCFLNITSAITLSLRLGSYTTFFFAYVQILYGIIPLIGKIQDQLDYHNSSRLESAYGGAVLFLLVMALIGCKHQIGMNIRLLDSLFERTNMYNAVRPGDWEFGWRLPIPHTGTSLGELDQIAALIVALTVAFWSPVKGYAEDLKEYLDHRVRTRFELDMSRIFGTP